MRPIQKRIRRAFLAFPDREFKTVELVEWCYPRLKGSPQRKHRWAICVAARRVVFVSGGIGRAVWCFGPCAHETIQTSIHTSAGPNATDMKMNNAVAKSVKVLCIAVILS